MFCSAACYIPSSENEEGTFAMGIWKCSTHTGKRTVGDFSHRAIEPEDRQMGFCSVCLFSAVPESTVSTQLFLSVKKSSSFPPCRWRQRVDMSQPNIICVLFFWSDFRDSVGS